MLNAKLVFGVGLAFCGAFAQPMGDEDARQWLLRSMTSARRIAAVATVTRPDFGGGKFTSKVRIEQHTDGRMRHTVLDPPMMAGVVSVDDGKTWTTYLPKLNRIFVQESPRIQQGLPSYQVTIAGYNYELSLHRGPTIAGRRTVVVSARPKAKELSSRRFYLDRENAFLLRITVTTPDGQRQTVLDTEDVDFNVKLNPSSLKISAKDAKIVRTEAPKNVASLTKAKGAVGFVPISPKVLPFGFIVKQTQLVGSKDAQFIASRLTDGMAVATMYQWSGKEKRKGWPFDSPFFREVDGVRLAIIGDLPKEAADALIDAFVRR